MIKVGVVLFIIWSIPLWAAEPVGYRVSSSGKTLIQIAREVYNDQREWKEIAEVNGIRAPYALYKGQVLRLPKKPVKKLASENRVARHDIPAAVTSNTLPSVARQMAKDKRGRLTYTVNERAPTLYLVAEELYGQRDYYKELVETNQLHTPYRLALGQKLRLKTAPKMSAADGDRYLIREWDRLTNDKMVERLQALVDTTEITPKKREIATDAQKVADHPFADHTFEKTSPKVEERRPYWTDYKMPELFPTVVAPAAPVAKPPVYVVQMTNVPVGSICITPPQPFSNDPRWVIQPMPVGVAPTYVNPSLPSMANVSPQMMNAIVQMMGSNRAVASVPAGAQGSATTVAVPAAIAAPASDAFTPPSGEPPTSDYWMGHGWKAKDE